ncbi:PAS/PAC sensor signal transduction histidine kinase [Pseudodesulfovibrio mercurii]|uniref:histidine kinase n=1 Tax=Pseudodesulfovibrio mercurii TaxID=641491 RepID=F0JI77_9BACT|nr:PAS domain-containing sensor histidine kinase [Pseudodesulfovibrio mercurii]EGB15388.1 PAS/PAC sensor signal transduction histidine kinase [Pseudodesulfovibrio mercurii]
MTSSKYSGKAADSGREQTGEREKLIGLGRRSISKSYYPELKSRLDELEHFRALLDRVNDAIFVVDADSGRILDVSGAADVLLGCDADRLRGLRFADILPPHIRRHADNLFHNETKTVRMETEFSCPLCQGKPPVPVDLTLSLVSFRNERQAIIVARDISERKRNERALKRSHDQLELRVRERTRELDRANRAKSEFLSTVSHELRTPLTAVLGFAKVTSRKLVNSIFPAVERLADPNLRKDMEVVRRNLEIIAGEGQRLTLLINDVLDLAKMEAHRVEYVMAPVSPEAFIRKSVEVTSALFEDTDLTLRLDLEPDLPLVNGDADRLMQVMVNLISNAVKFTPQGVITCAAHVVDGTVRVGVTDTGVGIRPELLQAIFEEFTQVGEHLSDRPAGTGLGLTICKHIVEGHGGHIWAESRPGHGSTFLFTLPVLKGK